MSDISVATVVELHGRIVAASTRKSDELYRLVDPKRVQSLLGSALYRECVVHVLAVTLVVTTLCDELKQWVNRRKATLESNDAPPDDEVLTPQFAWDQAIVSLQRIEELIKSVKVADYLEIAWVIAKSAAVLIPGVATAEHLTELVDKLKEARSIWRLRLGDAEELARGLAEIELYAGSSLVAVQQAVVFVGAATGRNPVFGIETSLAEAAGQAMAAARDKVSAAVLAARQQIRSDLARGCGPTWTLLQFPPEGWWPDLLERANPLRQPESLA